jgi:hypothetical protein
VSGCATTAVMVNRKSASDPLCCRDTPCRYRRIARDRDDIVACGDQPGDHRAPDEPGRSGYQDVHACPDHSEPSSSSTVRRPLRCLLTALSLWQMTGFSLQMGMEPIILSGFIQGFIQGFGLGCTLAPQRNAG